MKKSLIAIIVSGLFALNLAAHPFIPGKVQDHPILLKGGDLYTIENGVKLHTDILFDNGRITALGENLQAPAGAEIIDVTGQRVYPGLIDAGTSIGLIEIGAVRATNDQREVGQATPEVKAQVGYNPDSEIIPTVRSNGVTTVLVVPGGGVVTGRSALMNLDGWTREDCAERLVLGMHMNWPQVSVNRGWWEERPIEDQKRDMEQNRRAVGQIFADARAYFTAKQADPKVKQDLRWEAMIPVLTGEMPLFVAANDYRQIEQAVAFAKEQKVRMIITGGKEAYRATSLLKENHIPVILSSTFDLPMREDDDYDQAFKSPAMLQQAGVVFTVATFDSWGARNLPLAMGEAVSYGLDQDVALRAITLTAAEILGVEKDLGSLVIGKKATLFVCGGDVLDMSGNHVAKMWIEGKAVDLNNRHKELYRKYQAKGK